MRRVLIGTSIVLLSFAPLISDAQPAKFDKRLLVGENFPWQYRPPYPIEARRQRLTGSGVYILHIDSKTGHVTSVTIQKSTGHKLLDDAVLETCVHWRFKPHLVTDVRFPITFSIGGR
jgi:TonB family protein